MSIRRGAVAALLVSCCVSACGGGGAGSGTGDSSGISDALSVPANPPPLPGPVYRGATAGAVISTGSAGNLSADVFLALAYARSFIDTIPLSPQVNAPVIQETVSGPAGGQVVFEGRTQATANYWLQETFTNYATLATQTTPATTTNGAVILEYSENRANITITYGFEQYHVVGSGLNFTFDGTVIETIALGPTGGETGRTLAMDFSVADEIYNVDQEFVNFTLSVDETSSLPNTTLTGRVYNQYLGYVDVATAGGEEFSQNVTTPYPIAGADIIISDSSPTKYHIGPLNASVFSAGIDSTGSGQVIAAERFSWNTLSPDTTPTTSGGPLAVALQQNYVSGELPVTPVTVDGRFSHDPDGDFLSFKWKLLYAPAGSAVSFSNTTASTLTFTPDVEGDYLIELDVSDGTQTARDTLVVTLPPPPSTGGYPTSPYGFKAGPALVGHVGSAVMLDGLNGYAKLLVPGQSGPSHPVLANGIITPQATYGWQLIGPAGSSATLQNPTSPTPRFVPDVPGYYQVTESVANPNGMPPASSSLMVSVDEDVQFDPAVGLAVPDYAYTDQMVVADVNNDGLPDIVTMSRGKLQVWINGGHGNFATPVMLPFSTPCFTKNFAVGDLNGDGRLDIAVGNDNGVTVFLQNADGSWGSAQNLVYGANCTSSLRQIYIAKVFANSTNSLLAVGYPGLVTWNYSGTAFGTPTTAAIIPGINHGLEPSAFADLTGDGIVDVVGPGSDGTTNGIFLVPGQSNGTFGTPQAISQLSAYPIAVDLTGNGHEDLIGVSSTSTSPGTKLNIFYGSSTGLSSTPVGYPVPPSSYSPIATGDINGDGLTDILVSGTSFSGQVCSLGIFEQKPDHSFANEVMYPACAEHTATQQDIWIADINHDGIPDMVLFDGSEFLIYFGHR